MSGKQINLTPSAPCEPKHLIYIYIHVYIYIHTCIYIYLLSFGLGDEDDVRDWSDAPMNQSKNLSKNLCFSQPLKPPKQFTLITLTAEVNNFPGIEGLESQPKKGPSFNQLGVLQNNGTPKMTMNQIKNRI